MSNKAEVDIKDRMDEDLEFVLLCRDGDVDAFEVLVERHQKKMLNIAYRMTDDYEDACDVVQEAFLSAFKSIKRFRGEARFSTWLTGILINHAKNRLKQVKNRSHHEGISINDTFETDSGSYNIEPQSSEIPVVEQLMQKEVQVQVQKCISLLDETSREVVILRDMQGFSYEEISNILKLPDGTIKSRLFRARDALRNCLKKVLGDL
ncbi:MAG: sigma-70 family RNA polymerase sigma factor [Proteobacteria bacterium]|nr:sigma-70 family RNA polymerase sigma factor [Pseudomonadota bacterium]